MVPENRYNHTVLIKCDHDGWKPHKDKSTADM